MNNIDIRDELKKNHIFGYQIAAKLGIAETSFFRMLARSELSTEQKQKILSAISVIKEETK